MNKYLLSQGFILQCLYYLSRIHLKNRTGWRVTYVVTQRGGKEIDKQILSFQPK